MPYYIDVQTAHNTTIQHEVATLWQRIAGYLVDLLIKVAYFFTLAFLFGVFSPSDIPGGTEFTVLIIIFLLPAALYSLLQEIFFNGQTIGKRVMQTRVVSTSGVPVGIGSYILRWLLRMIDIQVFSGLVAIAAIAAGGKGQRLGDLVAGTSVISLKKRTGKDEIAYASIPDDYEPQYPEVQNGLGAKDIRIIKEVLLNRESTRYEVMRKVVEKVEATLGVQKQEADYKFLMTIIKDYSFYNGQALNVEEEIRRDVNDPNTFKL